MVIVPATPRGRWSVRWTTGYAGYYRPEVSMAAGIQMVVSVRPPPGGQPSRHPAIGLPGRLEFEGETATLRRDD